jgi:hypothetical protein
MRLPEDGAVSEVGVGIDGAPAACSTRLVVASSVATMVVPVRIQAARQGKRFDIKWGENIGRSLDVLRDGRESDAAVKALEKV